MVRSRLAASGAGNAAARLAATPSPGPAAAAVPRGSSDAVFVSYPAGLGDNRSTRRGSGVQRVLGLAIFDDIRGGEKWRQSIVDGITGSSVVVLVLSPNSLGSENVEREISLAQEMRRPVLPLQIAPVTMDGGFRYLLAGVQLIDGATRSPGPIAGAGSTPSNHGRRPCYDERSAAGRFAGGRPGGTGA
ncbi:MAG: toll/interleukin-1 receptor domain-containing protein [Ilumatobacteraceae bacterium]